MLRKVNGYEICQPARARQLDMPIIMLTAKGQEDDIVRGLEVGADDYVTKPFSIRELIARLRLCLRRQGPESAEYESAIAGSIWRLTSCSRRGRRSSLRQGVPLVEFLCEARGPGADAGPASWRRVWGDEVIVTDRSVDRVRNHPARQDRAGFPQPTLHHTIRDIGYRL